MRVPTQHWNWWCFRCARKPSLKFCSNRVCELGFDENRWSLRMNIGQIGSVHENDPSIGGAPWAGMQPRIPFKSLWRSSDIECHAPSISEILAETPSSRNLSGPAIFFPTRSERDRFGLGHFLCRSRGHRYICYVNIILSLKSEVAMPKRQPSLGSEPVRKTRNYGQPVKHIHIALSPPSCLTPEDWPAQQFVLTYRSRSEKKWPQAVLSHRGVCLPKKPCVELGRDGVRDPVGACHLCDSVS